MGDKIKKNTSSDSDNVPGSSKLADLDLSSLLGSDDDKKSEEKLQKIIKQIKSILKRELANDNTDISSLKNKIKKLLGSINLSSGKSYELLGNILALVKRFERLKRLRLIEQEIAKAEKKEEKRRLNLEAHFKELNEISGSPTSEELAYIEHIGAKAQTAAASINNLVAHGLISQDFAEQMFEQLADFLADPNPEHINQLPKSLQFMLDSSTSKEAKRYVQDQHNKHINTVEKLAENLEEYCSLNKPSKDMTHEDFIMEAFCQVAAGLKAYSDCNAGNDNKPSSPDCDAFSDCVNSTDFVQCVAKSLGKKPSSPEFNADLFRARDLEKEKEEEKENTYTPPRPEVY